MAATMGRPEAGLMTLPFGDAAPWPPPWPE
jgi:hypothetical protein